MLPGVSASAGRVARLLPWVPAPAARFAAAAAAFHAYVRAAARDDICTYAFPAWAAY